MRATGWRCCRTTATTSCSPSSRWPASVRSRCRSTSCSPPRRSPTSSGTPAPPGSSRRTRSRRPPSRPPSWPAPTALRGAFPLQAQRRRRAGTDRRLVAGRHRRAPEPVRRRRRRAGAADVHERHRVPPEGRDADQPQPDRAVLSCIVDGEMSGDDVEMHSLPLYHCAQLHCFLSPTSTSGRRASSCRAPDPAMVLADHRALSGRRSCSARRRCGSRLLRHPDFDRRDLSSLRKGYYGASIMPTEVLQEMRRRLPDVRLFNFYGQTEMAPLATLLRPEEQLTKPGSAGRPALNVETAVVDDDGRPVAPGDGRRDRAPQPARDARLLERPGEDCRGVPRRLVPQRRPRRARRGRLPQRRRPQEGHDQDRRRERRQPRGRGGRVRATPTSPRSRSSASRTRTGSRRSSRSSSRATAPR